MDIKYINELLQKGKTVKEVRSILGVSEKLFQKKIKELGYKYNQKNKQYEVIGEVLNPLSSNSPSTTTNPTTKSTTTPTTISTTEATTIKYLSENIDILKQILENYKRTTTSNNKNIVINLVNDKHLKPAPKSIRINEFVWRDWLEFTKDLPFSKGDLVSQALIEFIEKYK